VLYFEKVEVTLVTLQAELVDAVAVEKQTPEKALGQYYLNVDGAILFILEPVFASSGDKAPTSFRCQFACGDKNVISQYRKRHEYYIYDEIFLIPAAKITTTLTETKRKQELLRKYKSE
jgi:hypothetical protein